MKQLLLSISFLTVLVFGANAQCTPDPQYTIGGVYPDSATGLAPAYVGQPYNEVITVIVPVDTTIMVGPIPFTLVFDSVVVSDWQGLPPGFTVEYYSPNNQFSPIDQGCFEGAQTGCILISGTPTAQDVGSYQQLISTDAYSTPNSPLGEPTLTLVDYYYIDVMDTTAGVSSLTDSQFALFPNPAKEVVTLNGLNKVDVSAVSLFDMNGKQHAYFDSFTGSSVDITIENMEPGMYFVRIDYNGVSETLKFIKE
ncbi:MAG: T9SS type A sorting domain-containing protein [Fluviicola sp.]